jgi:hypothetical protein
MNKPAAETQELRSIQENIPTGDIPLDFAKIRIALKQFGISDPDIECAIAALPNHASGILLYGSRARGDFDANSDIDLLVVCERSGKNKSVGIVNASCYSLDQYASARGTLFGFHLFRDSALLHDSGSVQAITQNFAEIDLTRLWRRVGNLASLLTLPDSELQKNIEGFIRHARYVLRTAKYAQAIEAGSPCFSVKELALRSKDPELEELLSSNKSRQTAPSLAELEALTSRIIAISEMRIGQLHTSNIYDLIVNLGEQNPELANAALMALDRSSPDSYHELRKVQL